MVMKICVCLKQIVHTYACSGRDPGDHFLDQRDTLFCINPCDEAAVALAVAFKAQHPGTEVVLLTLGPIFARDELARCLAMGADRLFQVVLGEAATARVEPDPWVKSVGLARAVRSLGGELVLCGKESLDGRSGQIGVFMAHQLGVPFVSGIIDLQVAPAGDRAHVRKMAGRGRRHLIEAPLPAVFSVDLSARLPAAPAYADRQAARSTTIEKIIVADPAAAPRVHLRRIYPPKPRPKRVAVPDGALAAFERVGRLLQGSRIEKKGRIIKGDTSDAVEEILTFLQAHDYI
jgi:electron transfer flavoprotein beta subunit